MPILERGDILGTGVSQLVVEECGECCVLFAIPQTMREKALADHSRRFFCPNGHSLTYLGKTEAQKLREQLDRERQRAQATRDLLAAEERSHAATRGHLTRAKKRAVSGVCPHPDCHRHFANLERHVAAKHPELVEQVRTATPETA